MSPLSPTQVSFVGGKRKNLYFWEGAFHLKCSQGSFLQENDVVWP